MTEKKRKGTRHDLIVVIKSGGYNFWLLKLLLLFLLLMALRATAGMSL